MYTGSKTAWSRKGRLAWEMIELRLPREGECDRPIVVAVRIVVESVDTR
jgi:hypothetical protein